MKPGPLLWHTRPQLPVCLPTLSQWTHNQLDSPAIFTAINAIRLERKSIRCVHLCRRVRMLCRSKAAKATPEIKKRRRRSSARCPLWLRGAEPFSYSFLDLSHKSHIEAQSFHDRVLWRHQIKRGSPQIFFVWQYNETGIKDVLTETRKIQHPPPPPPILLQTCAHNLFVQWPVCCLVWRTLLPTSLCCLLIVGITGDLRYCRFMLGDYLYVSDRDWKSFIPGRWMASCAYWYRLVHVSVFQWLATGRSALCSACCLKAFSISV